MVKDDDDDDDDDVDVDVVAHEVSYLKHWCVGFLFYDHYRDLLTSMLSGEQFSRFWNFRITSWHHGIEL